MLSNDKLNLGQNVELEKMEKKGESFPSEQREFLKNPFLGLESVHLCLFWTKLQFLISMYILGTFKAL